MPFDVSQVNWVMWAVVLIALAVGWTLLRVVMRLTTRIFMLGCLGLVALVTVVALVGYLGR